MDFYQEYSSLADFIGAWFIDCEIEGISEEEVVKKYTSVTPENEYQTVLKEAEHLQKQAQLPFKEMGDEANIHFKSSDEVRYWLEKIIGYLKKYIDQ